MPSMIRKLFLLWVFPFAVYAQNEVEVKRLLSGSKIEVYIDKKFFTAFCYPDSLTKPILFPIMFVPRNLPWIYPLPERL